MNQKSNRVLPILFNTDMVRAILDGRKTVTRRVIKPQPIYNIHDGFNWKGYAYGNSLPPSVEGAAYNFQCAAPYQPGDILYVRETWRRWYLPHGEWRYEYKATNPNGNKRPTGEEYDDEWESQRWHPSIHMPKEAARIWLKVTDVRVERLQDITEEQAEKEGCNDYTSTALGLCYLWDSTLKKSDLGRYGWDTNPWVWVIEFERCEKPENI